jgi:hypothetical protein
MLIWLKRLEEKMKRYGTAYIVTRFATFIVLAYCFLLLTKVGQDKLGPDKDLLIKFSEHNGSGPISVSSGSKTTWTKSYDVEFAPGEELLIVAELHNVGEPMQPLGQQAFTGSTDPRRLTITFARTYEDAAKTIIGHSAKVQLAELVFEIPEFTIDAKHSLNGEVMNWFQGGDLRSLHQPHTKKNNVTLTRLLSYHLLDKKAQRPGSVPDPGISSRVGHRVVLNMIPMSRLKYLAVETIGGLQGLDGETAPPDHKQSNDIAERHKRCLIAPPSKLTYWKTAAENAEDNEFGP